MCMWYVYSIGNMGDLKIIPLTFVKPVKLLIHNE
jgi:hypothetical protein